MNERAMCGFSGIRAGHGEWGGQLGVSAAPWGAGTSPKEGQSITSLKSTGAIGASSSCFAPVSPWIFLSPPPLDPLQQ